MSTPTLAPCACRSRGSRSSPPRAAPCGRPAHRTRLGARARATSSSTATRPSSTGSGGATIGSGRVSLVTRDVATHTVRTTAPPPVRHGRRPVERIAMTATPHLPRLSQLPPAHRRLLALVLVAVAVLALAIPLGLKALHGASSSSSSSAASAGEASRGAVTGSGVVGPELAPQADASAGAKAP